MSDQSLIAGRSHLMNLQLAMEAMPNAIYGSPAKHYFAEGVYVREYFLPKDTVVLGRIHKKSQVFIVASGEVSICTEKGTLSRLKAPCIFESPAGVRRAVYAHEDAVMVTAHGTHTLDPDELLDEISCTTFEEYDRLCGNNQLALEGI